MAQASVRSERGRRARRWCTRAILVLGGTVVGTAAAWAVSTTNASAAPSDSSDRSGSAAAEHRSESADRALEFMNDPAHFLRKGAEEAADSLRTGNEPHPVASGAESDSDTAADVVSSIDEADEITDVEQVREDATGSDGESVDESFTDRCAETMSVLEGLLGSSDENPLEDTEWGDRISEWFGPQDIIELPGSPIAIPGLPGTLPADDAPATAPGLATEFAGLSPVSVTESGTSSRTTSDDVRDVTSELPSGGMPLRLPMGAPTAPFSQNGGHAGHGNADGSTVGATFASGNAVFASLADTALTGTDRVPFEPGRQPGVTPD